MSDYRAIAGVSASLRNLLRDRMEESVAVTIAPPDVTVTGTSGKRINLYLYQVSENGYLKNQDVLDPGHAVANGRPPLPLDLYYLLTTYGESETSSDADLQAQQLLGDAMRVLHDFAIITDQLFQEKTPGRPPVLDPALLGAFERAKISLEPVTVEELSKIWTALPQASFRRSVAYQVSVVQIESKTPRRFPRPVGEPPEAGPRVRVVSLRTPRLEEIRVHRAEDIQNLERTFPYARLNDTLILLGSNLAGEGTRVILGAVDATPQVTGLRDERIDVTVPDDSALQPGPHPVKVLHPVLMGEPPTLHSGFQSNLAVFVLVPKITSLTPDLAAAPRTLEITGTRLFHPQSTCLALVGEEVIESEDYILKTSTSVSFELPASLGTGEYRIRVRVNGVESLGDTVLTIP